MTWSRPTLADLINRTLADISSRLPGPDALLRRSNLNVLARVHAGVVNSLYGAIAWLAIQLIYDTAESTYLDRWASIWGIYRQAPTFATGFYTATGTTGTVIPAGTELQRNDGELFTVDADTTILAGTASVAITAVDAGSIGNSVAGTVLTLTTPINGVVATGAVVSVANGYDAETDNALRARFLNRIQNPPQGGAESDYVTWALQVSGVTRAWCYPQELGPGTVTVRFVRDGDVSIFPNAGAVTIVQTYINALRPVTANLTVVAPIAAPLNFALSVTPNTADVQNAVIAELASLMIREAVPGGTIPLAHIRTAIGVAAGETNYVLTTPSADVVNATGYMTSLGTFAWS